MDGLLRLAARGLRLTAGVSRLAAAVWLLAAGTAPCLPAGALPLVLLLAAGAGAQAADPPRAPSATPARLAEPIVLDGRLTEEAWRQARPITGFVQRNPDEGRPATERTEAYLVYDDDALYVGARLFDREPAAIVRRLSRRDGDSSSDLFRVYLDPHHDHKTGVMLRVAADGSLADSWLSNDFDLDPSWDGVWDAATSVDGEGWTVEMRIPFSQLRFPGGDHRTWGFNASRFIQRKNEDDWWVAVPKNDTRLVSAFGHLEGLAGIRPRRHLELLPYATATVEADGTASAGNPFTDGSSFRGGAGLDIKWGMTSSFTLDGTINPDFGQVEVDPAVVNLTAYETFYEEKRPFFIEGSQQFANFGRSGLALYGRFGATYPTLWYSRMVGRAPRLTADGDFVSQPGATTTLGAAKVTGRTASGWSLSLVDAVTDRESARSAVGPTRAATEVEPFTNYFAARVSRDLWGRGSLGVLGTAVNRSLRTPELRAAAGASAYVAGLDGSVFLDGGKAWVLSGSLAGSHVRGEAAAIARLQRASARYYQRPDAPHVSFDPSATSLSGWTGQINLNRTRGNLLVDAALWAISPGFESNDVGFSPAADRIGGHSGWVWQKTTPDRWTRERSLIALGIWLWNTAGDTLLHTYDLQGSVILKNYWMFGVEAQAGLPHLDDRAARGGPIVRRPGDGLVVLFLSSDQRKRVALDAQAWYGRHDAGGRRLNAAPRLVVRPSSSLTLSIGPQLSRSRSVAQYVTAVDDPTASATFGRRTIFSTLDQTEVSMVTRVNAIFTPRISFEVYAQPLISSGRYRGLKELATPRTFDFNRYGIDAGTISYDPASRSYAIDPDGDGPARRFTLDEPDFNYRSLRVNAVFRWEWRPGSTLYAVWTQQRESEAATGDFGLGRGLRSMFGAPGDHVFMVKMAYWLGK